MGTGDLNFKKSWHPSSFQNRKKVWEAQQAEEAERKKLDILQKERIAEQESEEMIRLQESAGLISKKNDRVDWMYSGAATSSTTAEEDYFMGKKRATVIDDKKFSRGNNERFSANKNGPLTVSSKFKPSDEDAKRREDPMYLFNAREQEIVESMAHPSVQKYSHQSISGKTDMDNRYKHKGYSTLKSRYGERDRPREYRNRSKSPDDRIYRRSCTDK